MNDANNEIGEFTYFGIKKALADMINPELHPDKFIELQVNADGVLLKKSSSEEFWVLSGKIHFEPDVYDVFPIAIFYGKLKPQSVEKFLADFIEEINDHQANSI